MLAGIDGREASKKYKTEGCDDRHGGAMELEGILVKTAKGANEIQTRANRLAQKKRTLLILVDGNISVESMVARFSSMGDIRETSQELLDPGYVEFKRGTGAAAAAPAAAAGEVSAFNEAARALSRSLYDLIGPSADDFTGRLEVARERAGFLQAAASSIAVVASFAGKNKAELFRQRAMALADRFSPE